MKSTIQFPKIGQFRQVVRAVAHQTAFQGLDEDDQPIYDGTILKPTLPFRGTVKLHGTNGSVVLNPDQTIVVQSRNRVLSLESDNAGFAMFVLGTIGEEIWKNLFANLVDKLSDQVAEIKPEEPVILYGEWAGGNIQSGVGLSKLEKMFVVFGLRVGRGEQTRWIDIRPFGDLGLDDQQIYSIYDERFPCYELDIDFENPGIAQNKMIEITEAIEKECPVAKAFGVSGIGEGCVWSSWHPDLKGPGSWFKVKGVLHSSSKVKTLAPIDVERMKTVDEFIQKTVTENRCRQGLEYLKEHNMELTRASTGDYIRWIINDIFSEELDTMVASNITHKELGKPVGMASRKWFFDHLNNEVGLEH